VTESLAVHSTALPRLTARAGLDNINGRLCVEGDPALPTPARIRSTIASYAAAPEELRDLRTYHKALADVTRLRLIQRLAQSAATVSELKDHVDLSQPLVSWHVRALRTAGLIDTRRSGREVICSLRPDAFADLAARERAILGIAS
jgi:DNA-binding transcriptional ArsR family regulator